MTSRPAIHWLPYQKAWLADTRRCKIGMMSRQIGKTFVAAAEIVADCVAAEAAGRRARWVILSRGERQAGEAMTEAVVPLMKAYQAALSTLRWRLGEAASADPGIRALEVRLAGGSRITALPATADTARGFSASVLLDEFAFHQDSRAIWRAVFPVISRPGLKIRVISTPNGKGNKFYELMEGDAEGVVWARHRVDIHQAVAQGLDRDVAALRAGIADPDAWAQEYELQWLDAASAWLPLDMIAAVEDRAAGQPEGYRGGPCWVGVDIGRRRDLWVAWVWEKVGDVFWTREVAALRTAPFATQAEALAGIISRYRVVRCAMDQTGMGEMPVEEARRRHGSVIEGVLLTGSRPLTVASEARRVFEGRRCRIPVHPDIRADLHKLRKTVSATGAPRIQADRDRDGHADRAWAAMLGLAAASGSTPAYGYEAAPRSMGVLGERPYRPGRLRRRPDAEEEDDSPAGRGGIW